LLDRKILEEEKIEGESLETTIVRFARSLDRQESKGKQRLSYWIDPPPV
jgi:hypothetical protein